MYVYGVRKADEDEEGEEKNGECEFLKEYISINISNVFHLELCTISK